MTVEIFCYIRYGVSIFQEMYVPSLYHLFPLYMYYEMCAIYYTIYHIHISGYTYTCINIHRTLNKDKSRKKFCVKEHRATECGNTERI